MKNFILQLFCAIGLSAIVSAQSSLHLYGTCESSELVSSIAVDSAGYQYVLNETENSDYYHTPLSLSKLTPSHDLVWTKTIGLDSNWQNIYTGSVLCVDSTVFVGGTYFHNDPVTGDYGWRTYLARFSDEGDLLWFKNLDENAEMYGTVFLERLGNNLLYSSRVGISPTYIPVRPNICCLDMNGDVLWSKRIENVYDVIDLQTLPDSSFLALGYFPSQSNGIGNTFLSKISSNGDVIWQNSFTTSDSTVRVFGHSIVSDTDSTFLISGDMISLSDTTKYGYFGKFNSDDGTCLFSKKAEVSDNYVSFNKALAKDGLLYIIGISRIYNAFGISPDLNLTKIATDGSIEWMFIYNDSMNVNIGSNQLLVDAVYSQNSIITVGCMANYGAPYMSHNDIIHTVIRSNGDATHKKDTLYPIITDYPLVSFDTLIFSSGFSSDTLLSVHEGVLDYNLDFSDCMLSTITVEEKTLETAQFSIYPNPVTDLLNIESKEENLTFIISDMTGRILIQTNEHAIDVSSLAPGYYLVGCELGQMSFYKS